MRIAVLEAGEPPAPLQQRHGRYPAMMERMLRRHAPSLSFIPIRIAGGEAPPPFIAFDGVLITGSPAGVYDGLKWIAPLEAFVRDAATAGRPVVGICFGHQLMAQAFGGRVEKSDRGWGVGVHEYQVYDRPGWMRPDLARIACAVSHQDQIVEPPAGARILAGSEFCPYGAVAYEGAKAISFQMHPEFEHDFVADLIRARTGRLPPELVADGLASLSGRSDRDAIAQWIAGFYLSA